MMPQESGEREAELRDLCMRLRVEFSQEGAEGAWSYVRGGYFDDVLEVLPDGEGKRFEQGELENLAARAAENCEHPEFATDLEMHLQPLRLLYLRDLICQGRAEEAAFQAFRTGACLHRTNDYPNHYHARRKVQAGGHKKKGRFKVSPQVIRQKVGTAKPPGGRKGWKSEDELYKSVARLLILGKSTIKRHAGDLVGQMVGQTPE